MPFPDEVHLVQVEVVEHRVEWAIEAADLAMELRRAVPSAVSVHHVGSTSIPGMSAKDCLDMMILVEDIASSDADRQLTELGFRRRPEPWNNLEDGAGRSWPKMVFAPPAGARQVNVHVRVVGTPPARTALLFRDYLRSNERQTENWSALKAAAAAASSDLSVYGSIKASAWHLLMELAEHWATAEGWQPGSTP